jgi:hypothetical protein
MDSDSSITVINCRARELRASGYKDLQDFLDKGKGKHLYVGRDMTRYVPGAFGSKWKNPYSLKDYNNDADHVVYLYKKYVRNSPDLWKDIHQLKGKTLACWCYPDPCHATALKELYEEKYPTVPNVNSIQDFPALKLI